MPRRTCLRSRRLGRPSWSNRGRDPAEELQERRTQLPANYSSAPRRSAERGQRIAPTRDETPTAAATRQATLVAGEPDLPVLRDAATAYRRQRGGSQDAPDEPTRAARRTMTDGHIAAPASAADQPLNLDSPPGFPAPFRRRPVRRARAAVARDDESRISTLRGCCCAVREAMAFTHPLAQLVAVILAACHGLIGRPHPQFMHIATVSPSLAPRGASAPTLGGRTPADPPSPSRLATLAAAGARSRQ